MYFMTASELTSLTCPATSGRSSRFGYKDDGLLLAVTTAEQGRIVLAASAFSVLLKSVIVHEEFHYLRRLAPHGRVGSTTPGTVSGAVHGCGTSIG
jgi:hypothetical protein